MFDWDDERLKPAPVQVAPEAVVEEDDEVGLEASSGLQDSFNRRYGVRTYSQLTAALVTPVAKATLPKRPQLHFIPDTEEALGIEPKDALLMMLSKDKTLEDLELYVFHQTEPASNEGLTGTRREAKQFIQLYHKKYAQFNRVFKLDSALKSNMPVVVNYGLIEHMYPLLVRNPLRPYYRTQDLLRTQWMTVKEMLALSDRQQYVVVRVPKTLPSEEQLREACRKQTTGTIKPFNERRDIVVLDLMAWFAGDLLGDKLTYQSYINKIERKDAERITFLIVEDDDFTSIQLEEMYQWKEEQSSAKQRLSKLYDVFTRLIELRSPAAIEPAATAGGDVPLPDPALPSAPDIFTTIEQAKEEAVVTKKETPVELKDLTLPAIEIVDEMAEQGMISGREYAYLSKLPSTFEKLPNPLANLPSIKDPALKGGDFKDLLKRDTKDVFDVQLEKKLPPMVTVTDETYLKDRVTDFDKLYVEKQMQKDVAATVMSLQKAGIPITKYEVTEKRDAINHSFVYKIQTQPVNGHPSTFSFTLPVIRPNGTFISNGVVTRLDKQRADIPIVKVEPDECVLTSAMGKLFVSRTARAAYNTEAWLHGQILLGSRESEGPDGKKIPATFKNLQVRRSFDYKQKLPYGYTLFNRKFRSFEKDGVSWFWNYKEREEWLGKPVAVFEKDGRVVCGKKGDAVVVVDANNHYYLLDGAGNETFLGDYAEALGLPANKQPKPFAETKVFGRSVPVGMMLCYLLGIERYLVALRCKYEVVDRNDRSRKANPGEYVVVFKDVKLFISNMNATTELLINGFAFFEDALKAVDFNDLNVKGGFSSVFNTRQIGAHHMREFELMEKMWVDPMTELSLKQMREPTTFIPLITRAVTLITDDQHHHPASARVKVNKGYNRMVEMVYRELLTGVREYRNESTRRRNIMSINPNAVRLAILQDEAITRCEESSPIHNSKERERVTFNGAGGRSAQTLMGRHRLYMEDDIGFASEATTDNGKTGTVFWTSANPTYTSLYGHTRDWDPEKDGAPALVSPTTMVMPFATYNEGKRSNFGQIQASSWANAVGMKPFPVRTPFDVLFAHRNDKRYSFVAEEEGKVIRLTETSILVKYKSGKEDAAQLGKLFGRASGKVIPHKMITDMKEGQKFNAGEVLAWNAHYYARDWLNPMQVTLLLGVPVKVAMWETMDTYEDSSSVSAKTAREKYASEIARCRDLLVNFDDEVKNLLEVNSPVLFDTPLCTIIPSVALLDQQDEEELVGAEGLQGLANGMPKADHEGTIELIEILYCGKPQDASKSLSKLIKQDNARRAELSRQLLGEVPPTGEIEEPAFISGKYIGQNMALIRVYITQIDKLTPGDKKVLDVSVKTVPGRVFTGEFTTKGGMAIDETYSYAGVMNRIVESPKYTGTLAMILRQIGLNGAKVYRGQKLD